MYTFSTLDTPAKDHFDRPVVIEPVGEQLLRYSKQKCRYATWVSMFLFVISIPTIPGTFLASCALFSKPYGTVELLIVFNAFVFLAISPIAIYAGRKRNKLYYFPILIYTVSFMFMFEAACFDEFLIISPFPFILCPGLHSPVY